MNVRTRIKRARANEMIAKIVLGACAVLSLGVALLFVGYIFSRGIGFVSLEFITEPPRRFMTEGGILPAIVGTFLLTLGTALFTIPIGVMAGIYLAEYAPRTRRTRIIRLAIANMAGVPSVVYGLFGLALFVSVFGWGRSVLAGAATLACLTLPVIITATEEALRQIPSDLRQASLALGATRLRTIGRVVLPAAAPGIVTGSILGLSRAAGETAPILLTAVAFFAPIATSPMSQTMALPYHLFIMATQATKDAPQMVWGTALVLVAGISILNVIIATWRSNQRRKMRW
ncbi:MAG: phosphate ABC transporter permease PstA [Actinobacteria bacterium]|nr:phosphate ABC transporter permease PstA [Actinomycetota bacterium]MCL5887110.1 phosphate ABC transporter permease PstA [Actinomycetota bacterium]